MQLADIVPVLAGAIVGLLGLWLTVWAAFWDRSRGRRRCPKCWYDLRGTPGMRCSECGYEARHERQFRKTHRRWRFAAVGLMVIALGGASGVGPKVRRDGWMSLVPTTILLMLVPPAGFESRLDENTYSIVLSPTYAELLRREAVGDLWGWQWKYLIGHKGVIRTRDRWPQDVPLSVCVSSPGWAGYCRIRFKPRLRTPQAAAAGSLVPDTCNYAARRRWCAESDQIVGRLEPGATSVAFACEVAQAPDSWRANYCGSGVSDENDAIHPWSGIISMRVQAVPTIDDAITRMHGPSIDAAMQRALECRIGFGPVDTEFENRAIVDLVFDRQHDPQLEQIAFGFTVEFQYRTAVRAVLVLSPRLDGADEFGWTTALRQRELLAPGGTDGWTVVIRGNPEMALRDWDRPSYWAGEFTLPLADVLDRRTDETQQPSSAPGEAAAVAPTAP